MVGRRQRGRHARVERVVDDVAAHHGIGQAGREQRPVRVELRVGPRLRDVDIVEVGVGRGAPESREVLDRGADAVLVEPADLRLGHGGDDRRIGREAAIERPDRRVGRVHVDVDDRGEVQVDHRRSPSCAPIARPAAKASSGSPVAPTSASERVAGKPWAGLSRVTWPPSWSMAMRRFPLDAARRDAVKALSWAGDLMFRVGLTRSRSNRITPPSPASSALRDRIARPDREAAEADHDQAGGLPPERGRIARRAGRWRVGAVSAVGGGDADRARGSASAGPTGQGWEPATASRRDPHRPPARRRPMPATIARSSARLEMRVWNVG